MDGGLIIAFALIGIMFAIALAELVRVMRLKSLPVEDAVSTGPSRPIRPSTTRLVLLVALAIGIGSYFYIRHLANAQRDGEIMECMHSRASARGMCEQFIELRHRYD